MKSSCYDLEAFPSILEKAYIPEADIRFRVGAFSIWLLLVFVTSWS